MLYDGLSFIIKVEYKNAYQLIAILIFSGSFLTFYMV